MAPFPFHVNHRESWLGLQTPPQPSSHPLVMPDQNKYFSSHSPSYILFLERLSCCLLHSLACSNCPQCLPDPDSYAQSITPVSPESPTAPTTSRVAEFQASRAFDRHLLAPQHIRSRWLPTIRLRQVSSRPLSPLREWRPHTWQPQL
jgi:hypothetical protein